ncbi:phosphatase PAP2 family protein [Persicobacter diffluens]|uniref:Phosphatidic acid phosphatase type 2/haloperoxidase domain-containing protein n=1 Tax=Persicobacter diffluens TaxID=981 RepID=A0AAN4VWU4_9BACT|nr:hypothetical protein PEDI_09150 [Persicobacter diffluens]
MIRVLLSISLFFLLFADSFAQSNARMASEAIAPVYKVNRWTTGGTVVVGYVTSQIGFNLLGNKPRIPEDVVLGLKRANVNAFDRWVFNFDPNDRKQAQDISDLGLRASVLLPIALFIDKEIRKDWLDVSLMYLQSQVLALNIYTYLGAGAFDRYRPVTYVEELSVEFRSESNNARSFFSGHTSNTAVATFFAAQVLNDYHPHWSTGKKALMYGLAAVPPAFVGYYRMKGYKHFPTDVMTGFAVGAASGILIPYLHKRSQRRSNLVYFPLINQEAVGLYLEARF